MTGSILVVDDDLVNRKLLARGVEQQGHRVTTAGDGESALSMLASGEFDLVLLDILMPGVDGFEVLRRIKADPRLRHLPVVMVSALEEIDSVARCIELGAEDHLPKPFDPVLLRARINAGLNRKRLHDMEREYVQLLKAEQERSERLLLNVLPPPIAERLKRDERVIADRFADATVLFADILDFTAHSALMEPEELVARLNEVFSAFDALVEDHGLEKIKTMGDAYMAVGGVPVARPDHAEAVARLALAMQAAAAGWRWPSGEELRLRIGIHSGPVIAGVIGTKKFLYDLWGDTVNTASRMESLGVPGGIQVPEATMLRLKDRFRFEPRGEIEVKGKGPMRTWLLLGPDLRQS